ncbi:oligopeptide transport system substrate-binding protein [Actinokineospora alba]|uniref:Oligopeptide transport system substrate-binding protein n=2 Tax=Actinokineospora alba TaxID=504798 RepID=A0A1H0RY83_9PSEU|nr:oligopeptide transport system substrate-binding protein [Actinokineospora alba]SDI47913.1 oligopeptide transport system substrate-binding protein [Actinokineospora alba]SDP34345.1 oligopeptide transport system substrate-binding protein [Actinokineospora alba]
MRKPRWIAASVMPLALVVASCGGGANNDSGTGSGDSNPDGKLSAFATEPENPLVPGNTTESGGSKVIRALFTGLTEYDAVTGASKNAHAQEIKTTDSKVFTIKLKPGWKFHDGTDVKAKNYVDAWNYTAYSPNGQQGASFFEQVQGYKDVHTLDPDGAKGPAAAPEPASKTMSGLKVIDDTTFEVTLGDSFSVFPLKLGYNPFYPLPDLFFSDQKAFEAKPVGNGPFKFVSRTPNADITLTRYDEYQGEGKPKFKDLVFKIFETTEAAYTATVSGELDFLDTVPPSGLAGGKYKTDLPNRNGSTPYMGNQVLAFPLYDPKWGNADLRKAISMAINRDEINEKIFDGTKISADGWVNPAVPGYVKGQCGELCTFNPTKAKEYLAKSGFTGKIDITTNADGGHLEWMTATCNSIKNALGLECTYTPIPTFAEARQIANAKQYKGIYRAGWIADYPSIENFMNQLYRTGASSNDGDYSNPKLDALLVKADAAPTVEEANKLYQEAERILAEDMPAIPLWNQVAQYGWSEKIDNARLSSLRELDLTTVTVKK